MTFSLKADLENPVPPVPEPLTQASDLMMDNTLFPIIPVKREATGGEYNRKNNAVHTRGSFGTLFDWVRNSILPFSFSRQQTSRQESGNESGIAGKKRKYNNSNNSQELSQENGRSPPKKKRKPNNGNNNSLSLEEEHAIDRPTPQETSRLAMLLLRKQQEESRRTSPLHATSLPPGLSLDSDDSELRRLAEQLSQELARETAPIINQERERIIPRKVKSMESHHGRCNNASNQRQKSKSSEDISGQTNSGHRDENGFRDMNGFDSMCLRQSAPVRRSLDDIQKYGECSKNIQRTGTGSGDRGRKRLQDPDQVGNTQQFVQEMKGRVDDQSTQRPDHFTPSDELQHSLEIEILSQSNQSPKKLSLTPKKKNRVSFEMNSYDISQERNRLPDTPPLALSQEVTDSYPWCSTQKESTKPCFVHLEKCDARIPPSAHVNDVDLDFSDESTDISDEDTSDSSPQPVTTRSSLKKTPSSPIKQPSRANTRQPRSRSSSFSANTSHSSLNDSPFRDTTKAISFKTFVSSLQNGHRQQQSRGKEKTISRQSVLEQLHQPFLQRKIWKFEGIF